MDSMKFFRRFFYLVLVPPAVAGVTALAVWLVFFDPSGLPAKVDEPEKSARQSGKDEEEPGFEHLEVKRPEISHLVDGVVKWTVRSETIKNNAETGLVDMVGSSGLFVRDGDGGLEFAAPVTEYDSKTKSVTAKGGVEGKLVPEDSRMKASDITWDGKTGKVIARKVEMETENARIQGEKMEIKPGEKTIEVTGDVKIEIELDPEKRKGGSKLHKTSRP